MDHALGELMRREETGELVDRDSVVKDLGIVYNKSRARKVKKRLMPGIRRAFKVIRKDIVGQ